MYLNEATILHDDDILAYWRSSPFIHLKPIARKYLCAPASSVESERVFSALGDIYDERRYNLSGEHAHMQLFLRYFYMTKK